MTSSIDGSPLAVLFLNGTVGAGKTATAFAVGDVLRAREVAHQIIDLDELRRAWPAPAADLFHSALERANLASMAANAAAAGLRVFVVAGVIEDAAGRTSYERILGPMTVVRLFADPATLRERLMARHEPGPAREWHLARAGTLAAIIDSADIDDRVIDTTRRCLADVAVDAAASLLDRLRAVALPAAVAEDTGQAAR